MLRPGSGFFVESVSRERGRMHQRIILNQRLIEASKARLPPVTAATLHGRGVFTTLAVYGGRPFLWDAHWWRLKEHAKRAGVECGFEEKEVKESLARLVEANKVEAGRARVTLLARDARGPWELKGAGASETDILIITGDARRAADDALALSVSPYRLNTLSPLAGVKSVNYLEHVLSWEEARARDFDEAIVLNERGEVASATMANIFWVKQGTIHTPALQTGALAGTTRACVIELAEELAVPVIEGDYHLHDVGDADEIFLTSASLGVGLVTMFDFHRYRIAAGSVALRLREAFRQLTLDVS
ncbi:MAG: aminotransferase class IV [Acidobacteria bacterium]|nr:aminotransferase class IV [Acidobacteriota bacterium]